MTHGPCAHSRTPPTQRGVTWMAKVVLFGLTLPVSLPALVGLKAYRRMLG